MDLIRFFKPTLRRKDMDAVLQTMVDEKIGPGERRKEFLKQLAAFLNLKDGITNRSYPEALMLALKSAGVKAGDKIIASVLSPEIYKTAAEALGAELLLADVSAETGCLSEESISRAFEKGGSAILLHEPVCQLPSGLENIRDLGLPVIEDVTQSFGSRIEEGSEEDKTLILAPGMTGDIVVCAFEEDCIISTGGGAAVLSKSEERIDALKKLASAWSPYNDLPDMNAALGIIQLSSLDSLLARRNELYKMFMQSVMKTENKIFGLKSVDFLSNGYVFPVVVNSKPDDCIAFAKKYSVSCKRTFTKSVGIHYQDRFDLYPNAIPALNRGLSFPLYPFLQQKETEALNKVLSHLP